jgi:hypothetical protein
MPMHQIHADKEVADSTTKFSHSSFWYGKNFKTQSLGNFPELGLGKVGISGTFDFVSYYRNMPGGYPGLSSPTKSLDFTPYPGSVVGNYFRQPLLNLILSASPSKGTSFAIEYALSHTYTGLSGDSARQFNVQNMLQIHGFASTKYGTFMLTAGGGSLLFSMSPLTMFNKDFREPMFEKLPWDWYTKSYEKYESQYSNSSTSTPSYLNNSATQGFILDATDLPLKMGFSAFYGRSTFTASSTALNNSYPTQLFAGKLYHGKDSSGKLALNYYNQFGYINNYTNYKELRQILTAEYKLVGKKMGLSAEFGAGRIIDTSSDGKYGEAIHLTYSLANKRIKMPLQLQLYSIDKRVAALESAYLNANDKVLQGGASGSVQYNNTYYPSYLQEVTMMANNRQGVFVKIDKEFKKFRVELGNAISVEKENLSNTVSFQHMTNAFSRSRFRPWLQNQVPYGMMNYRFRRTFETIAVTDTSNYRKVYNATDLSLKFKSKLFNRGLILCSYTYAGGIGKTITLVPNLSSKSFVYTVYQELSAYYNIHPKLTLLGFYSEQIAKANTATQLSTENSKPVNQRGIGYGFGVDYDFANNAGLFLRHRWMQNEDKSFVLDKFKGQETIVELKIFF